MTNCYCFIYWNPSVLSWLGAQLCSPQSTCSISGSSEANKERRKKESCDCSLLISLCGCIVVLFQLLPVSLEFQQEKPQAPLVLIFQYLAQQAKDLLKQATISRSFLRQNSTMANIAFCIFQSLMTQFSSRDTCGYLLTSISSDIVKQNLLFFLMIHWNVALACLCVNPRSYFTQQESPCITTFLIISKLE